MESAPIKLHINKDRNLPEPVSTYFGSFSWEISLQSNAELRKFVKVECSPVQPWEYWECDLHFNIETSKDESETVSNHEEISRKFSNYTNVNLFQLEEDVQFVVLTLEKSNAENFMFTKESLFDEPVDNITDCKLIVEKQTLYVCKKMLATYSKYFYNLFYNDDTHNQSVYIICDPCNSFRVFLNLLYGQDNLLNEFNFLKCIELAGYYDAYQCLEKCEKFFIEADMDPVTKTIYISHYKLNISREGDTFRRNNDSKEKFKFTEVRPNLTDVVLFVDDKKFYVSKQILAHFSSYFYTMFYSDFVEKGRDEIELKEIDSNEFEMFLEFVHYSNHTVMGTLFMITDNHQIFIVENIEAFWKLSQMYDAQLMIQKFTAILKRDTSMNDAMKIKLAVDLNIPELSDHVISKNSFEHFSRLLYMEGFNELDDSTVGRITKLLFEKKRKSDEEEANFDSPPLLSPLSPDHIF